MGWLCWINNGWGICLLTICWLTICCGACGLITIVCGACCWTIFDWLVCRIFIGWLICPFTTLFWMKLYLTSDVLALLIKLTGLTFVFVVNWFTIEPWGIGRFYAIRCWMTVVGGLIITWLLLIGSGCCEINC
jgi:hypothetical protein